MRKGKAKIHFLLKKGRSGHFCVFPPWFYVIEGYIQPYGLGGERLQFNSNQLQKKRDLVDLICNAFQISNIRTHHSLFSSTQLLYKSQSFVLTTVYSLCGSTDRQLSLLQRRLSRRRGWIIIRSLSQWNNPISNPHTIMIVSGSMPVRSIIPDGYIILTPLEPNLVVMVLRYQLTFQARQYSSR
jgi:hypothetical protein